MPDSNASQCLCLRRGCASFWSLASSRILLGERAVASVGLTRHKHDVGRAIVQLARQMVILLFACIYRQLAHLFIFTTVLQL